MMTRTATLFSLLLALSCLLSACQPEQASPGITSDPVIPGVIRESRPDLSEDYARFRAAQISAVSYTLSLRLPAEADDFSGQVTIEFTLNPGNRSPLTIDYDSGEVLAVSVNGEAVPWDYQRWFISLPASVLVEGVNQVRIDYRRPYARDGDGLHKFTDPANDEVYLYTNFEPYAANRWFPHFDQPNLKAPLSLDVIAPADWTVIANTMESRVDDLGLQRHWWFPPSAPISSYIYGMHAGPFTSWEDDADGIPLRLFVRNSLAQYVEPELWFEPTRRSFAFFQDYFEVPYPFGKYDQVIVPEFNAGAMENVGAVTFNERYVPRGAMSEALRRSLASVIAHEMAHMWFGNLVTMDWWNGLWLNESFATYMANLALEFATDFDNVWDTYYLGNKLGAYRADQLATTHPIDLPVASTSEAFSNFDAITYGKGGSVLKQLPFLIGEENFRRGVSEYLMTHAYGNTTLDDFVTALSEASGMDLEQWRLEWLTQSGVNTLRADLVCSEDRISELRLLQLMPDLPQADKVLRTQRTQVGLYRYGDQGMRLDQAIAVTYSGDSTPIPEAVGAPCPDLILPNEDDWAYVKISLDARSRATLETRINQFPSATTRIMLWQALWESVEAAEMPLTNFVDFVLASLGEEADINVLRHVGNQLSSASALLRRMDRGADKVQAIEDFMWRQLLAGEPGSEAQRLWFDNFSSQAHGAEALDYLSALLQGEASLDGLPIDQDKRWSLIIQLSRHLHPGHEALLAEERERDRGDQGQNMAMVAEAIRPLEGVKRSWLEQLIEAPDSLKLASMRLVTPSLFPSEQSALLAPFQERILAAIPILDGEVEQRYLGAFINLRPALCTPASVARLVQANEDFRGLDPVVVKAFLVMHQEDERCVRMKALL